MNIRGARQSLSTELLSSEPGVVAVGLTERGGEAALTVLLDGPVAGRIPAKYEGYPVVIVQSGAFHGAAGDEAREVA